MNAARRDRIATVATLALLALAAAAFARGWWRSEMFDKLPWHADGAWRAAGLSLAWWLAYAALAAFGTARHMQRVALAAVVALAAAAGPLPVLAAALVVAAGTALGLGVLSRNGRENVCGADLPLAAAVGLGLVATLLAVLGLWPIATPFTVVALLALPLLAWGRPLARALAHAWRASNPLGPGETLAAGLVGHLAVLLTAAALLPEVGNDALGLHLVVAAHVADTGGWHYDVLRHLLAVMPLGVDFLYAAAYLLGGESAARLVNLGALFLTVALVYATVRAAGGRGAALLAAALCLASPLALLESSSLFVDNAWALFVVAGLVALLQFAEGASATRLVAGGLALGGALATKTLTLAAFPAAAVLLVVAWRARPAAFPWRTFALAVIAGLATALPPYLIAWVQTGNPVFPFFNGLFRSPLYLPADITLPRDRPDPLLLYRMTFYSDRYLEAWPGAAGFAWLLLLPPSLAAAVAWGRRSGVLMLFAALSFAAVVVLGAGPYLRYLFPALFLFHIAFGITLARLDRSALARTLAAMAVASIALSVAFWPSAFAPARDFELAPIHDAAARTDYVARWAPTRPIVAYLNALPGDAAVAFLGTPPYVAELKRPGYADNVYTPRFFGRTAGLRTPDDIAQLVADFRLGYIVLGHSLASRLRASVEPLGTPRLHTASATLYEVHPHVRFPRSLLAGSGMETGPGRWIAIGEAARDVASGVVLVDHLVGWYQRVPVHGGLEHHYAVEARCHDGPADVRLQVIWHTADGRTSVSHRAAACLPEWTEDTAVFVAPVDAVAAAVFALGHGTGKVEVRRVTFRAPAAQPLPLPPHVDVRRYQG